MIKAFFARSTASPDDSKTLTLGWYVSKKSGYKRDEYTQVIDKVKENKLSEGIVGENLIGLLKYLFSSDLIVTVVPSSTPDNKSHGVTNIVKQLAEQGSCIDGTSFLLRKKKVEKAAYGGTRDTSTHLSSIEVKKESIEAKDVCLMDDVITSGSTMDVSYSLLSKAGVKRIFCLALGKTVPDKNYMRYNIHGKPNFKILWVAMSNLKFLDSSKEAQALKIKENLQSIDTLLIANQVKPILDSSIAASSSSSSSSSSGSSSSLLQLEPLLQESIASSKVEDLKTSPTLSKLISSSSPILSQASLGDESLEKKKRKTVTQSSLEDTIATLGNYLEDPDFPSLLAKLPVTDIQKFEGQLGRLKEILEQNKRTRTPEDLYSQ